MGFKSSETLFIDGRVKFPVVHKPKLKYKSTTEFEYSVQVEFTEERLKKLKEKGVHSSTKVKIDEDDGRFYLNVFQSAISSKGEPNVIIVTDAAGKPLADAIGNGSKARVIATLLHYDDGSYLRLAGIQVTELVEYIPKAPGALDLTVGEVM